MGNIDKYNSVTLLEVLLYIGIFSFFIFTVSSMFIMINHVKGRSQVIEEVNFHGKEIVWYITRQIKASNEATISDSSIILDGVAFYLNDGKIFSQTLDFEPILLTNNRVVVKELNMEETSLSEYGDLIKIDVLVSSSSSRFNYSVRFYGAAYLKHKKLSSKGVHLSIKSIVDNFSELDSVGKINGVIEVGDIKYKTVRMHSLISEILSVVDVFAVTGTGGGIASNTCHVFLDIDYLKKLL